MTVDLVTDAAKAVAAKLEEWFQMQRDLLSLATREKALRAEIFGQAFPNPTPGTNKLRLPHEMALIGDYRFNYKLDRPVMEATLTGATDADRAIIESIVTYRPEVSDSKFRGLDDNGKRVVGPFITQTPGLPGLEIKPAAKVRW